MRDYITIVSGIPRSGTSLMMRMLRAGGIPALTDRHRPPDQHNPHGYFEDQRVRRLAEDASWMHEAQGKAIKVIYRLLPHLPPGFDYRILFMLRNLEEIFDSQQDMLAARQSEAMHQDRGAMIQALQRDLDQIRACITAPKLDVPYPELIATPQPCIAQIAAFLDADLNQTAMKAAIDPTLYRHKWSGPQHSRIHNER